MTDHDDRLASELREYYAQLARQPAPDVTGRVMAAADSRALRLRRLSGIGGGMVAAAAAVAVVVLALANHGAPSTTHPASSPTPLTNPSPTVTPEPAPVIPVGPPVQGFIASDVTAISAQQWWVIGYDGASCSSASCTRIVHTTDGGQTFGSLPTPPVAPGQNGQQHNGMRFADAVDGWVFTASGALWATHDGGGHWTNDGGAGRVTDLEASGGYVYVIACAQATSCVLERSPAGQDAWSTLAIPAGSGTLGHLNVNGSHVWLVPGGQGGTSLLVSADGGGHFSTDSVCTRDVGIVSVYAVNSSTVWATCATGTQASALRSVDGGQHFSVVAGSPRLANFASVGGVSSTEAVIGAQALFRTVDGGQTFATVEDNQTQWSMVGFTTSSNGFVFDVDASGQRALWRSNDAGAHWYRVQFP
ncbi:MAG TPA: hypothetical protein VH498_10085 [Candidatus Dormibacteraeota bacterium]|nr:hypothetical protein [Candidatus Dormibacteraeota bacterium]